MNQIELHPYLQQTEMLDFCRNNGVHLTAYAPLGSRDRPAVIKDESDPILLEDTTIGAISWLSLMYQSDRERSSDLLNKEREDV